jgi:uncharacterized protein
MADDEIGYAQLTQDALRSVVRGALRKSLTRPPGDHHFYLTFRTRARGMQIADFLIQKYPEEMTIVLQHQYEELFVEDDRFGVTLSFGGVPQRIVVPFTALTRFYDPHVRFALPFDPIDEIEATPAEAAASEPADNETPPTGSVVSLDAFRRKS